MAAVSGHTPSVATLVAFKANVNLCVESKVLIFWIIENEILLCPNNSNKLFHFRKELRSSLWQLSMVGVRL